MIGMKIIGLAGGIACGKSTVSYHLRELGAHIIDADAIAHALSAPAVLFTNFTLTILAMTSLRPMESLIAGQLVRLSSRTLQSARGWMPWYIR